MMNLLVLRLILVFLLLNYPIQAIILFKIPVRSHELILSHFTNMNWLVIGSYLSILFFSFITLRLTRYLIFISIILTIINNYWVGRSAFQYNLEETSIASLFYSTVFIYFYFSIKKQTTYNNDITKNLLT